MENMDLNEQERNRREALGKLRELGIDPYPAALYPVNATAQKIKDEYDPEKGNLADVVRLANDAIVDMKLLPSPKTHEVRMT